MIIFDAGQSSCLLSAICIFQFPIELEGCSWKGSDQGGCTRQYIQYSAVWSDMASGGTLEMSIVVVVLVRFELAANKS